MLGDLLVPAERAKPSIKKVLQTYRSAGTRDKWLQIKKNKTLETKLMTCPLNDFLDFLLKFLQKTVQKN
jgi:hypothetical protein